MVSRVAPPFSFLVGKGHTVQGGNEEAGFMSPAAGEVRELGEVVIHVFAGDSVRRIQDHTFHVPHEGAGPEEGLHHSVGAAGDDRFESITCLWHGRGPGRCVMHRPRPYLRIGASDTNKIILRFFKWSLVPFYASAKRPARSGSINDSFSACGSYESADQVPLVCDGAASLRNRRRDWSVMLLYASHLTHERQV